MLKLRYSAKFKRDFKLIKKRGFDIRQLNAVIEILADGQSLPENYRDHALVGEYGGHRECHITPDWLLIYVIENDILTLTLTRTGSHSDLF